MEPALLSYLRRIMGNSTVKLQDVVDDAQTFPELAPALPTGGYVDATAISIANDVMTYMLAGGPDAQPFNWKWNRLLSPTFFLNSYQQDYFIPNLVNLGWIESCTATNFGSTQFPKPVRPVEVRRDLLITNNQNNSVAKICWMQNSTMLTGVWGQSTTASQTGLVNPGPGVKYTDPSTQTQMPTNPITQVKDSFGNLWVVTTYGTCGNTNPFASNLNPVYPTLQNQSQTPTTVTDGTVVWTAVNPSGQGFRISPMPGQNGVLWQIEPVIQASIPRFTSLSSTLDPVPDTYYSYFKQGFFAQCFRRNPDQKVRAKFETEFKLWLKALDNAVKQGAREQEDWGFVPTTQVMDTGYAINPVSPAYPYGPWSAY